MRTHPASGCNGFNSGIFTDTFEPFNVTTGIIRYDNSSNGLPTSSPHIYKRNCTDELAENLHPKVPWYIDRHPQNNISSSRFTAAHQNVSADPGGYEHWMLTPDFLWLDFGSPTILNLDKHDWNKNFHVVEGKFSVPRVRFEHCFLLVNAYFLTIDSRQIRQWLRLHDH